MNKKIEVFTDGACSGNPGPGGWATIIKATGETPGMANIIMLGDHVPNTTNIEMELVAVKEALRHVSDHVGSSNVEVFTDSKYVTQTASGKWKVGSHFEIWRLVKDFISIHDVKFTWVPSHKPGLDNIYHEKCDKVAKYFARLEYEKAFGEMKEYGLPHHKSDEFDVNEAITKQVEMCKMEIGLILKKWRCVAVKDIEIVPFKP